MWLGDTAAADPEHALTPSEGRLAELWRQPSAAVPPPQMAGMTCVYTDMGRLSALSQCSVRSGRHVHCELANGCYLVT